MDSLLTSIVTIATAIVGLAIVSVLVSKNANTSQVIGASGNAFNTALSTAISPVTGGGGFTGGFSNNNIYTNVQGY